MEVNTQIIVVTLHKKRRDLKSGKTVLKPAQPEGPRQADLRWSDEAADSRKEFRGKEKIVEDFVRRGLPG